VQSKTTEGNLFVLGNLSLHHFQIGMVFFTMVMVFDIYSFGRKMRLQVPAVFGWEGKLVLLSIGCLIAAGWLLFG
jgi:hypothetical protein